MVGRSCVTLIAGSADARLLAARLSVTRMLPVLVCVGSDMATDKPAVVSCVITEAFLLTVIRSTVLVPSFQMLAAMTLSVVSLTTWALVEFSRIVISGLAAYVLTCAVV